MSEVLYKDLLSKYNAAEKEAEEMKKEIEHFRHGGEVVVSEEEWSDGLAALMAENRRLKYQLQHLQKNIREEQKNQKYCPDILSLVSSLFSKAIDSAYPLISKQHEVVVTPSTQEKFGDYQCNSAMALTKLLAPGQKTNPREVASNIVKHIPPNQLLQKTEVAGAGFINVYISGNYICQLVGLVLRQGLRPQPPRTPLKMVIDMSSPNIAKEMHVGHLRSTIIGESISRLYTFLGHRVLKLNHLGDWGTQFGMLITHLIDKFPDYLVRSPSIGDLQAFYRESKGRFDSDEDFKRRAYAAVVKLQAYDTDTTKAWNLICDASKKEFKSIYKRLDIGDLVDRGESFYQPLMQQVVQELSDKNMLQDDEGRKILWPKGCSVPLTIVKSDGGFTYDTSDLTALKHRLTCEQADELLYVIDAGQSTHTQGFFQAGVDAGWYLPHQVRVTHVGFGVVLGEDKKKFKTRSGDTVRLVDLLDEGVKRADQKLISKGRDQVLTPQELQAAREAVAYGCIKYADLSHCRSNDYVFSFDKMLDDKGNTAVYLLYAYMRIRCVVCRCRDNLFLHNLCDYLYNVATTFTEFYDQCYVVEKNRQTGAVVKVNMDRLVLCEVAAKVLKQGFHIVGIDTVEKM